MLRKRGIPRVRICLSINMHRAKSSSDWLYRSVCQGMFLQGRTATRL
ncbi:unnamed protein product [Nippostrongylus brasiliensis]|uniref:Uncharacterized protein n=1 Tax=Nippostrongylus brasiliensis TaxID=27835 RepID=A0A0N4XM03_NIPBR|nr:unnamed protein product [Nippostrongylus brasiliensis]